MRVVRGRAETIEADRAASRRLLDLAAAGEGVVRVWRPHRQVAFGRRDARREGYEAARAAASDRGYPPVERDVGGRAVAYTGRTFAFARAEPAAGRGGIDARYDAMEADVLAALSELGVDARPGEPPDSFCPGTHSLQASGKIVGIAQRVRQDAAITAGTLLVSDHEAVAAVLDAVYGALALPFDPDSVGSIARAGGDTDPQRVRSTVEAALVGGDPAEVLRVTDLDAKRSD